MFRIPDTPRFVKSFSRKEEKNIRNAVQVWNPFRDRQQDAPFCFCPGCGREQYSGEEEVGGLCSRCRSARRRREAESMTLLELSVEYRAQARVLQGRIRELRQQQNEDPDQKDRLEGRIWILSAIWRETRDQAVLLERYYERGYRRNGRYTL